MKIVASPGTSLPVLLLCAAFCACGTNAVVKPDVAGRCAAGFRVHGKVDYDGNREYLPRVFAEGASARSPVTYRYVHAAQYGSRDVNAALALFNPLTLVGFPTGGNTVRIAGQLDVVVDNAVVKTYTAGAALDKTRSLFAGETFTEMRRIGLIAVRDNIEAQICGDGDFLAGLAKRAPQNDISGRAAGDTTTGSGEAPGVVAEGARPAGETPDDASPAKTAEDGIAAPALEGDAAGIGGASTPPAARPGPVGASGEIADLLKMAKKFHEEGDDARAIGVYKRILNVYPGNKEASEGLLGAEKARAAAERAAGRE